MRHWIRVLAFVAILGALASAGTAQQSQDRPAPPKDDPAKASTVDAFVARLMAFDKNMDGKLSKAEITEERLLRTFDRADINKDGLVTKEELVALATQEAALGQGGGPGRGGPGEGARGGRGGEGGRGGRGGEGGRGGGPGGEGGRGGPGGIGRPQPGRILPTALQEALRLSPEQRKQVEELQKEVDARVEKILTAEQKKQLQVMREQGGKPGEGMRGGPGGPGGRPGRPGEGERRPGGGDKPARPGERP